LMSAVARSTTGMHHAGVSRGMIHSE
jgi:hypothetical protein